MLIHRTQHQASRLIHFERFCRRVLRRFTTAMACNRIVRGGAHSANMLRLRASVFMGRLVNAPRMVSGQAVPRRGLCVGVATELGSKRATPHSTIFVIISAPKVFTCVAISSAAFMHSRLAANGKRRTATCWAQAESLRGAARQAPGSLAQLWTVIKHVLYRIFRTVSLVRRFLRLSLTFVIPLVVLYPVARWLPIGIKEDGVAIWWWRFLVWQLEQGGPTSIKFGQWAGTRRDLFSDGFCNHVSQLHAASKINDMSHTKSIIEREFGVQFEDIFESFDAKPLGSGCVGQVHRAVLRDDAAVRVGIRPNDESREVVVKVLHPRVSDTIAKDLAIMHCLAAIVQSLPGMKYGPLLNAMTWLFSFMLAQLAEWWFGLVNSVEQFSTVMRDQLDFRIEAAHLARFRTYFHNDDTVVFPRPLHPYVTAEVLMETYERGRPIADYIDRSENDLGRPEDRRSINASLAKMGLRAFLKMVLLDNFAHSDLHPGNILVRQRTNGETQLVFLDAGIVTELGDRDSENFLALFDGIAHGNGEHVGYLMIENAREQECADPDEFAREIGALVSKVHTSTLCLSKVDVSDIMTRVLTLVRQHKVMIEPNFASLVLGIAVVEGLGRSLDPNVDIIKTSLPILLKARLRRAHAADAFADQSEREDWELSLGMDYF